MEERGIALIPAELGLAGETASGTEAGHGGRAQKQLGSRGP